MQAKLLLIALPLLLISTSMIYSSVSRYLSALSALSYKQADAKVIEIKEHFESFGIRKEAQMRFWIDGKENYALA
ncbi:MAG: hypothetical protein K2X27_05745, partial [Candidatus Obscuribacterales bacterium]|nr:hypothetical protein [Candidatus Obscuribacterales bacterium]